MPMSPRPATQRPITAPPSRAMSSASALPFERAASAVRTFAKVAAFIPMKPASSDRNAPDRKARPAFDAESHGEGGEDHGA
jgi:hypothetical protein